MTDETVTCPECASELNYQLDGFTVCSMCGHEWKPGDSNVPADEAGALEESVIRDSVGNILADGDSVVVTQNLKVKGSSQPIKAGTKVKGIRLVNGVGDHDIDCRIEGFGPMQLKSTVVKKA